MKTATPSDLSKNDCVLFEYRRQKHIRRVTNVEHDERFANPGGGGDLYRVTFEPRFELPDSAEYPPTNEIVVLDESDLGDVMTSGFALVKLFVDAVMPDDAAFDAHALAENSAAELREIFENAKAT